MPGLGRRQQITTLASMGAVRGEGGGPRFAVVTLEDLTGNAAAYQRLQQGAVGDDGSACRWRRPRLQQFVDRIGQEKALSDDALKAMLGYDWPGNLRGTGELPGAQLCLYQRTHDSRYGPAA